MTENENNEVLEAADADELVQDELDAMDDLDDLDVSEEDEEPKKEYSGRRIMCFVSKRMVAVEDTVDIEYSPGVSYKVHERYQRF